MSNLHNEQPKVRPLSAPESVPLFNCRAYLSGPDETGRFHCRCANLAGIEATGDSPRVVLQKVVTTFKSTVQDLHSRGEAIEFVEPPSPMRGDEQVQLIPVHL